jgi:Ser-tRNA(Ala) deacylase AlaX
MPVEPKYHTAEHILTAVMKELYNGIILDFHLKGNKVRCDYNVTFDSSLEDAFERIENRVNEVIIRNLDISYTNMSREEAERVARLSKVPEDKDKIRLVKIGDYNTTACSGNHVSNTSEIGKMEIRTYHQHSPDVVRLTFMLR